MKASVARNVGRSLRRIVDALQRSLFDAQPGDESPAAEPVAPPAQGLVPRGGVLPVRTAILDGRSVSYRLRRSSRRSIGFQIGEQGLLVSAPKSLALREIDAAVHTKRSWIVARLDAQQQRAAAAHATRIVWCDGVQIQYLGEPLQVVLDATGAGKAATARLTAPVQQAEARPSAPAQQPAPADASPPACRTLLVALPADAAPERIRDAVHGWLQREARTVFAARCAEFAARLDVRVTRISLSSAATRWGSASSTGRIRLHWRLIQFPFATIDYVVAHELAHLREMNHGAGFWAVVRSVLPGYESARDALRQQRLPMLD